MADRATVFQGIQLGLETVPGTAVPANRKLTSFGLEPSVKFESAEFRPFGSKYASLVVPGTEMVEAKLSGIGDYNQLTWPLVSLLNYSAPVGPGVPTTGISYMWTLTSLYNDADTPKTFTVEQGDTSRAHSFTYGLVTELGFTFSRSEISVEGSLIGRRITDGAALTASPTTPANKPILPGNVDIYMADTFAGLAGASALTRAFKADFKISDKYAPIWAIRSADTSFAGHVESEPKAEASLLLAADATGMGLLTTMRAGDTKWFRIKALGPAIETTFLNTFQIDFPAKIMEADGFSDSDGVYAMGWKLLPVVDSTWGSGNPRSFEIKLQNIITAAML